MRSLLRSLLPAAGFGCLALVCPAARAQSVPSTAYEAAHLFKATPGRLTQFHVDNHTQAAPLWVIAIDAASIPADGALAAGIVHFCQPIAAATASIDAGLSVSYGPQSDYFVNGIVLAVTSGGCFTKTTSGVAAYFSAMVQ